MEVQVIFVSADHDAASFAEYYRSQPWAAIPYEAVGVRKALNAKFGITGIPAAIVLSAADGKMVSRDGRSVVVAKRKLKGAF